MSYIVINGQIITLPLHGASEIILENPGNVVVATDVAEFEVRAPGRFAIEKVILTAKTAPVGGNGIIAQIRINGNNLFVIGNKPQITSGNTSGESGPPIDAQRVVGPGDVIVLDFEDEGSMTPGADVACHIIGRVQT